MFQVGRFDPRATTTNTTTNTSTNNNNKKTKDSKKRKRERTEPAAAASPAAASSSSLLRVIAPEAKAIQVQNKLTDEALDDFDVDVEAELLLLENEQGPKEETHEENDGDDYNDDDENKKQDPSDPPKPPDLPKEISRALHMSTLPIQEAAKAWNLAPFLVNNLQKDGYETFFPIQSLVIPDVIASERHARILQCRDVCVAAPTGSGKTLAFCIPVLNSLSHRVVRRLRALVVLPSRDLAAQVFDVFQRYAQGSNLTIGLAIGQSDFNHEQQALMVGQTNKNINNNNNNPKEDNATLRLRFQLDPTNLDIALRLHGKQNCPIQTTSAVDVLVATPGRLIDHLDKTPGFSLEHLRFLVIDEADRLVSQSYHSFIGRIMESVNSTSQKAWNQIEASHGKGLGNDFRPITWRRPTDSLKASLSIYSKVCQQVQLRKLLFSATMTKDPQKLATLGLVNPKYYDAYNLKAGARKAGAKQYAMPSGLTEYTVESTAEQKPLFLLSLLLEHKRDDAILVVFTSSLDSTHRLARLLQLLWHASGIGNPSGVAEFSSALNQTQRSKLVKRCNETNEINVIVCSDGLSRGMDIQSVRAVINYDVPGFAKTYVHRCGRTARAGRDGIAISLLKTGQIQAFHKMRQLIEDPQRVSPKSVSKDLVRTAFLQYKTCIAKLRDIMNAETNGDLNPVQPLPSEWFG